MRKWIIFYITTFFSLNLFSTDYNVPVKAKIMDGGLIITSSPDGIINEDKIELEHRNLVIGSPDIFRVAENYVYIKTPSGNLPPKTKVKVVLKASGQEQNNLVNTLGGAYIPHILFLRNKDEPYDGGAISLSGTIVYGEIEYLAKENGNVYLSITSTLRVGDPNKLVVGTYVNRSTLIVSVSK